VTPTRLAAMGIDIPWPVSFSTSRSLAMICSTLCFFTGTKGLLRSYQICSQPQTKWTDLRGPDTKLSARPQYLAHSQTSVTSSLSVTRHRRAGVCRLSPNSKRCTCRVFVVAKVWRDLS